jgi:hypothetical protein
MNSPYSVLLYSKYSDCCKKLFQTIENFGLDIKSVINIKNLCIDNKIVRNRIKQNNQMEITKVPVILTILPDGVVEKYEGEQAFQWIEGIFQQLQPAQPQPIQPAQPQHVQYNNDDEQFENIPKKPKITQKKKKKRSKQQIRKQTLIADLEDDTTEESENIENYGENDEDNYDTRYAARPPMIRIIKDEGNYEENDELFKDPQPERATTGYRGTKDKISKVKTSTDVMNIAQQMQKSRENFDSKKSPPTMDQIMQR